MRKSSLAILLAIVGLIGVVVYFQISEQPQLSEEEQIHMFLAKGQTAIESKNFRGIMSCVSADYSDSMGFTRASLRLQVADAMRAQGDYDVTLEDTAIQIHDNTALVDTRVSVALIISGNTRESVFNGPLTMTLRKEDTKRLLVIPTRSWKVVRIDGLPTEFTD